MRGKRIAERPHDDCVLVLLLLALAQFASQPQVFFRAATTRRRSGHRCGLDSASGDPHYISEKLLLDSLDSEDQRRKKQLEAEIKERRDEIGSLITTDGPHRDVWQTLAQSLLNLKEFIYVR